MRITSGTLGISSLILLLIPHKILYCIDNKLMKKKQKCFSCISVAFLLCLLQVANNSETITVPSFDKIAMRNTKSKPICMTLWIETALCHRMNFCYIEHIIKRMQLSPGL